jgi:hypothetical protein
VTDSLTHCHTTQTYYMSQDTPHDQRAWQVQCAQHYTITCSGPCYAYAAFQLGWSIERSDQECKVQGGAEDDKDRFSGPDTHSTGSPQQSHTDKDLEEFCTSQGGICLVGLLDAASEGLPADVQVLKVLCSLRRCEPLLSPC